MSNNAEAVQVMTGPTASWVHHAAAGIQGAFDISAVAALGVVAAGLILGTCSIVAGIAVLVGDDAPPQ